MVFLTFAFMVLRFGINSIDHHLKSMNLGQFKNTYKEEMTKKY